jgi:transcriptional regulator
MYRPVSFAAQDEQAREFVEAGHAGDLVTAGATGLDASLVPYVVAGDRGEHGSVLAHLSRQNDQWRDVAAAGGRDGLLIVRGPDGYVSPGWYAAKAEHGRVVPTWDYVVAHVHGRVVVHDDAEFVEDVVRRLTDRHESGRSASWSVDDAPERFVAGQLRSIVGVELVITRIELKLKLSQNRSEADIDGVVAGFAADGRDDLATLVGLHRPDGS